MTTAAQRAKAVRVAMSHIGRFRWVDLATARIADDAPAPGDAQIRFDGGQWKLRRAGVEIVTRPFPKQLWECLP